MESTATLPSLDVLPDQLLREDINAERAWKRETLVPEDWLVPLSEACHAELDEVVKMLRTHPQPIQQLTPQMFSLPACTRVMAQVRRKLQQQIGFAVIDRLPVERYSAAENTALGWLMASRLLSSSSPETLLYSFALCSSRSMPRMQGDSGDGSALRPWGL